MRRRGFTLVELMVVIGIITLLATILLPMANRARAQARKTALASDLQVLVNAIDAYQNDYGDIPRPDRNVGGPFQGSVILSWALLAPGPSTFTLPSPKGFKGDGADGIGFRVRGTSGTVHGPYLSVGTFRVGNLLDPKDPNSLADPNNPHLINPSEPFNLVPSPDGVYDDSTSVLGEREGRAILYFPRKRKVTITSVDTYFGPLSKAPAFVANDNDPGLAVQGLEAQGDSSPVLHEFKSIGDRTGAGNPWAIKQFQLRMPGVIPNASGNPTLPDPNQATKVPYILWDAGPDGRFCTDDDVTNFRY